MKYPEFQRLVLQLISLYSIHGSALPSSYGDLGDYALKIPGLLNAALEEIAAVTGEYPAEVPLSALEQLDPAPGYRLKRICLPEDFLTGHGAYVVCAPESSTDTEELPARFLVCNGTQYLLGMYRGCGSEPVLHYRRRPTLVDTTPNADLSSVTLDGSDAALYAAAYYTAAMLLLQDDAFAYSALRNEYSEKLSRLQTRISGAPVQVRDCYGLL